jgi:hypothetical protein
MSEPIRINATVRVTASPDTAEEFAGLKGVVVGIGHEWNGLESSEYDVWVQFKATHGVVTAAFRFDELEATS